MVSQCDIGPRHLLITERFSIFYVSQSRSLFERLVLHLTRDFTHITRDQFSLQGHFAEDD